MILQSSPRHGWHASTRSMKISMHFACLRCAYFWFWGTPSPARYFSRKAQRAICGAHGHGDTSITMKYTAPWRMAIRCSSFSEFIIRRHVSSSFSEKRVFTTRNSDVCRLSTLRLLRKPYAAKVIPASRIMHHHHHNLAYRCEIFASNLSSSGFVPRLAV